MTEKTATEWLRSHKGQRHTKVTSSRVHALALEDDCQGICCACGADAYGVEPDARGYTCEDCGEPAVFGAEEIALELFI